MLLIGLLLLQAVNVPPPPTRDPLFPPADAGQLSLVVADTVSETDPRNPCGRPDCTPLFLGRYKAAVVLAGQPLDPEFTARIRMGSPWNMSYRLALIVEQRDGSEPLVRAVAGFNDRTGEACFDSSDTDSLGWTPDGPSIKMVGRVICATSKDRERSQ